MAQHKIILPEDLISGKSSDGLWTGTHDNSGENEEGKGLLGFVDESKDQAASENIIPLSPQWLYAKASDTNAEFSAPQADNSIFEKERCGICMDIVMDRGVLDSCNHLFCFACIDNWATITNLCPLCKNEFQLITCLPVYDTFGNFKTDNHSMLSDDNWCIQERDSLLSFPSYYINEDAVKCLDGNGCKIRNGISTAGESLMLDTSIACDSCDIWYHAFCVGFDPETTSGSLWLCPRCLTNEAHYQSDLIGAENGHQLDATFTGKVSISIADAGETAIVVSMFERKQTTEASDPDNSHIIHEEAGEELRASLGGIGFSSTLIPEDHHPANFSIPVISSSDTQNCPELSVDLSIRKTTLPDVDLLGGPSTLTAIDTDSVGNSLSKDELPTIDSTTQQNGCVTTTFLTHPGCQASKSLTLDNLKTACTGKNIQGSCSHDDQKVLSDGDAVNDLADYEDLEGDNMATCAAESKVRLVNVNADSCIQGRSVQSNGSYISDETRKRERNSLSEVDIGINEKKARTSENFQSVALKCEETSDSCIAQNKIIPEILVASGKENRACDIMSIVHGTSSRSSNKSTSICADDKNGRNGFRVKKIMRVAENSDSSVLVQKLKNEIREAVRNNPSKDFGRDGAFDGKLLAAFRAAVAGPKSTGHKVDPSFIRMKKSLLQTGKARENLTKKIYGTSSGKRRRAWDREWEVEFWKHRCLSKKTEKVETLQSVLDLLNKISSGNLDNKENPEEKFDSSILSRVYLADTSVFPRKDDIQPLSVLGGYSLVNDFNKDNHAENDPGEEARCQKAHAVEVKPGGQISTSALKLKGNAKDMTKSSHGPLSDKDDKRKWALEVLARKRLSNGGEPSQGKHEDTTEIKGSYPLLAQLPVDMRPPTVAPGHHSKVPVSVRQAQLYRLTEFYLREANVSTVCRTAVTELAVADAINVEKEIFERSSSKLVYINLCAQHTIHYRHRKTETISSQHLGNTAEETKGITDETTEVAGEAYDSIEAALKMTGLLSDSPTNSPDRLSGSYGTEDGFWANSENNHHDNVTNPDTDIGIAICGNLKDDVEGMANIAPSRKPRTFTFQLRSADGDLKRKEIFVPSNSENRGSEDHPCKATPGREQIAMGCDSLMFADALADSPIVSAHRHRNAETTSSQHLHNTSEEIAQIADETTVVASGACDTTEETLKMTGLFSDSPTNSPKRLSGSYGVVNTVSSSKTRTFTSQLRSEDVDSKMEIFLPSISENLGSEDHPCNAAPEREPITMEFDSLMVADALADSSIVSASKHEKAKEDSNSKCLTDCQGLVTLSLEKERSQKYSMRECEQFHDPKNEPMVGEVPRKEVDDTSADTISCKFENGSKDGVSEIKCQRESCADNKHEFIEGKHSQTQSARGKNIQQKENMENSTFDRSPHCRNSVSFKVEAYIKEHIRPLCKSGVITVEQYRWAVGKTTDKVMGYHSKDKNANFLVKEGDKVKRLAEQYVEAAQQKDWN